MKKTIIGTLIALGLVASFSGCEKKGEFDSQSSTEVSPIEANTTEPVVETAETK